MFSMIQILCAYLLPIQTYMMDFQSLYVASGTPVLYSPDEEANAMTLKCVGYTPL